MTVVVESHRRVTFGDTLIRLVKGDITELEVDGFVFYAQPDLSLGSGFGGMIAVRGGPSIQKELEELGPVPHLGAAVSGAGNLKAHHIIHAVGPKFREEDTEPKLLTTMENTLRLAEEIGLKTLAFPAMGAGYYGIPASVSATVMLKALENHLTGVTSLEEVVLCVLDAPQLNAFESAMKALQPSGGSSDA
jgi:O-acetyl-ADP-ribose deacetylase (regulator of RNase III)